MGGDRGQSAARRSQKAYSWMVKPLRINGRLTVISRPQKQPLGTLIARQHLGPDAPHAQTVRREPALGALQEPPAPAGRLRSGDQIYRNFGFVTFNIETHDADRRPLMLANEKMAIGAGQDRRQPFLVGT